MAGLRPRRRGRDLNPRWTFRPIRDFQSRSLGHSDTSPDPQQSTRAGIRRPHGQSPSGLQKAPPRAAPWTTRTPLRDRSRVPRPGLDGRTGKAHATSRRTCTSRLWASAHAADQHVLGDAVALEKLRRSLEVNRVGQRPTGLLGLLWQPSRTEDVDDMLPRDLRVDQQPPSLDSGCVAHSSLTRSRAASGSVTDDFFFATRYNY